MSTVNEQVSVFLQWERATRDTIDVKKIYIDMADDLVAGVLLSQIVYWHLPNKMDSTKLRVEKEGFLWLVKGREDWWDECRIKARQFDTAMDKLLDLGLVEKKKFKFDGNPMIHIRIVWDRFLACFNEQLQNNNYNGESLVPHGFNESVNSNSQPKTVDTIGFNRSVNSESQIRELVLSKSVNSITEITTETILNECMGAAAEPAAAADSSPDPIYESLAKHVPGSCYVEGAPMTSYIPELYIMLINQFSNQLDPAVVEIACQLYFDRTCEIQGTEIRPKLAVKNPTGFFQTCYKDAIKQYKLTRYRKA